MYVNAEQRRINVAYFNVDLSNVSQHRNNFVIFNAAFQAEQRRNNVVNMIIWKK